MDRPDDVTAQLRGYADVWRDISGRSDQQVAELVRSDQIDILVDLTMHMAGNRLLRFRPQACAGAGVPGWPIPATTGLTAIDYRLTDPHLDPPGWRRPLLRRRIDPAGRLVLVLRSAGRRAGRSIALPALKQGHVTFGCLNNFCKVNPPVLKLWAEVLAAVDRSRLMILAPQGSHRQSSLDLLAARGRRAGIA